MMLQWKKIKRATVYVLRWHKKANAENECQNYHPLYEISHSCLHICSMHNHYMKYVKRPVQNWILSHMCSHHAFYLTRKRTTVKSKLIGIKLWIRNLFVMNWNALLKKIANYHLIYHFIVWDEGEVFFVFLSQRSDDSAFGNWWRGADGAMLRLAASI